ncbi:hypothetical protein KK083_05950 [Fulvivirgaceae bacterium PWU4]|uniref:Uncharacterized protein n=1 Tax=Chryseosolibacter histidini TaxID=2782349 RepID=A0AAP2DIY4_9BACT|nr:hypothetical protein [Chryseosolibacter histidini]MBT1696409.1 hypothetical protein [Chryseosolibacter histidini]
MPQGSGYSNVAVIPACLSYSHTVEVKGNSSLLIISGLNGYFPDGKNMPESFEERVS